VALRKYTTKVRTVSNFIEIINNKRVLYNNNKVESLVNLWNMTVLKLLNYLDNNFYKIYLQ
jgi:hypothetical protein